MRVLNLAAWMTSAVTFVFGIVQTTLSPGVFNLGLFNIANGVIFALIPTLRRFGELFASLTFVVFAYIALTFMCWQVGTDSGLQFYYLVSASLAVLTLGIEHTVLAAISVALGTGLAIALQFLVPGDTRVQPRWMMDTAFVISLVSATALIFATVWYAMREAARAEAAMEVEYRRSEALLANILPATVAEKLKDPAHGTIVERYDDASILFCDIAGFTQRASEISPTELVRFLDRLYTTFDRLVDRHGLEKIKTTGDSYMVVSGVPVPRVDHVEAIADLALEMSHAVADLRDPRGDPVPLRTGIASGPVVAGVVGARRFFYDVWGDAVNVASRMETTGPIGEIQVPENVYERLRHSFILEARGEIQVKGKGTMRTWYLLGRKHTPAESPVSDPLLDRNTDPLNAPRIETPIT